MDLEDSTYDEGLLGTLNSKKLGVSLVLAERAWATRTTLTRALADYIDGWYWRERRHSILGYLSPLDYETRLRTAA